MKRDLFKLGLCLGLLSIPMIGNATQVPPKDDNRITFDEEEIESTEKDLPLVQDRSLVADGNGVVLDRLGVTFFPPKGWDVKISSGGGPTVIMKEPKREVTTKNPIDYQRNIILSVVHRPSPIDKQRAREFRAQLMDSYGKDLGSYDITEMRFFDYRDKKDGLLVYASSKSRKQDMTHMHVLVSGKDRQVMMTYTDLSKRFTDQTALMDEAWDAMASVDVKGKPGKRFEQAKQWGLIGAISLLLILLITLIRRIYAARKLSKFIALEEAEVADEGATMVIRSGNPNHLAKTQAADAAPQLDIGLNENWYSNPPIQHPENNPLQPSSMVSGVWNLNGGDEDSEWTSKA